MNPFYGARFANLGDGFLLQDDINGIQSLYGEGEGSVTPLRPLLINTLDDVDDTSVVDDGEGNEALVDATHDVLSLREAISFSKFNDGRLKVGFDEAIFVDPQVMQTIDLDPALGPLNIPTKMIIEGPGSDLLTIQAADTSNALGDGFRIFEIMFEDPDELGIKVDVSISGLTLMEGDSAGDGGAIHSTENLTLNDIRAETSFARERWKHL